MANAITRQKVGQLQYHDRLPTRPELTEQQRRNQQVRLMLNGILDAEMISELNRQLIGLDDGAQAEILSDWITRLEYD